jgi:hypothetical protein
MSTAASRQRHFISGFFTACRSFAVFCKLSEPTGGNCRQLSDTIMYLHCLFCWMDFGFGNFKVWLFCCACRMHDEGKIGCLCAAFVGLLALFLTSILKLCSRLTNICIQYFVYFKMLSMCNVHLTLRKADVSSTNLV